VTRSASAKSQAPTKLRRGTPSGLHRYGSPRPYSGLANMVGSDPFSEHGFRCWSLIVAASLEELVYRGWLIEACRLLPERGLREGAMVLSVVAFAFLHLDFGWAHVLAKGTLGSIALLGVLTTGSVVTAMVVHVWFNVWAWNDRGPNHFVS
jgi:hypothetical protein